MSAASLHAGTPAITDAAPRGPDGAAAGEASPGDALVCVRVWDRVVRVTHWVIALSIVVLAVTGVYIGRPFLVAPGPAGERFVMGTMRAVHFYAAIAFTLAVLSRIFWMFVGSRHARWTAFLPLSRERREGFVGTIKFYMFLRREPPPTVGHNPVAGLAYVAVFGLYLVMIATGLGLYAKGADVGSPLRALGFLVAPFGGPQLARWFHHVVTWLLLGFVVHHCYSAWLMSTVEKNGVLDSIFSGNKWMPRRHVDAERPAERR